MFIIATDPITAWKDEMKIWDICNYNQTKRKDKEDHLNNHHIRSSNDVSSLLFKSLGSVRYFFFSERNECFYSATID